MQAVCPICESVHIVRVTVINGHFKLVKCEKCEFVFIIPRPTLDELEILYQAYDDIPQKTDPKSAEKIGSGFHKTISRNAIDAKRVLEIGCSSGRILYSLELLGYWVSGTDLSSRAIHLAKSFYGLDDLYCSEFPPSALYENFDVVIICHVIEHVIDPSAFVSKAIRYLRKDGILIIVTPNISSIGCRLWKEYYPVICPPYHLNFFDTKTLSRLVEHKCRILEVRSVSRHAMDQNFFLNSLVAIADWMGFKKRLKSAYKDSVPDEASVGYKGALFKFIMFLTQLTQFTFTPVFYLLDKGGMGENISIVVTPLLNNVDEEDT